MEIASYKGIELGSLKRTMIAYREHVELCCEYGLEENLAFEILL